MTGIWDNNERLLFQQNGNTARPKTRLATINIAMRGVVLP